MLIIVTAATTLPVTLEAAIQHCRAPDDETDDVLVERALKSAVEYVEQQTELALAPMTLEYRLPSWPCWAGGFRRGYEIDLPRKPVRGVVSIEYLDVDENLQPVDAANWSWRNSAEGGVVRFKNNYSFPVLSSEDDLPVRVTFEAGYDDPAASGSGDDPNLALPQRAVEAVLLKTELGYDHGGMTEESARVIQSALMSLIGQLRVYR